MNKKLYNITCVFITNLPFKQKFHQNYKNRLKTIKQTVSVYILGGQ